MLLFFSVVLLQYRFEIIKFILAINWKSYIRPPPSPVNGFDNSLEIWSARKTWRGGGGEDEVDGIKKSRQGLGQVGSFKMSEAIIQSFLRTKSENSFEKNA